MEIPDVPQDEDARLTTLYSLNILDTQAEQRFDRLTRLAKRIFGVPIALVSLVDDHRQWFKSSIGLNVSETSRDISFCGHAILGNEVFIIPDAAKDDRFSNNPLVINEPYVRFYAGWPLKHLNGSKLGTLCIIDRKPRQLGQEDLEALQDLAELVERELVAVQLATLDDLTKISNRRGFTSVAKNCLSMCARQDLPASLVFFDLNEFKAINDKFGHHEGDKALVAFSNLMRGTFRTSDVFGRLGGDEFVVLLSNTSKKVAREIVNRFRQSIETHNQQAKRGYDISFCDGIVSVESDEDRSLDVLLKEADSLMYEKKCGIAGGSNE
jgi:diguanylate cyclase (GGDEF)-like protein